MEYEESAEIKAKRVELNALREELFRYKPLVDVMSDNPFKTKGLELNVIEVVNDILDEIKDLEKQLPMTPEEKELWEEIKKTPVRQYLANPESTGRNSYHHF